METINKVEEQLRNDLMMKRNHIGNMDPIMLKRILNRSNLRKEVIKSLFKIGNNGATIREVAHDVGSPISNITGAVKGAKSRYLKEWSLIDLGLVEKFYHSQGKKIMRYRLTDIGKEIIENL